MKTRLSTVSADSAFLKRVTVKPDAEKILSDGADVAGMHTYFRAICASFGNLAAFTSHQCRGSDSRGAPFSHQNMEQVSKALDDDTGNSSPKSTSHAFALRCFGWGTSTNSSFSPSSISELKWMRAFFAASSCEIKAYVRLGTSTFKQVRQFTNVTFSELRKDNDLKRGSRAVLNISGDLTCTLINNYEL